jgi:hypothetical protein
LGYTSGKHAYIGFLVVKAHSAFIIETLGKTSDRRSPDLVRHLFCLQGKTIGRSKNAQAFALCVA